MLPFTPFVSHLKNNILEFSWVEITKIKAIFLAVIPLFLRNCEDDKEKQVLTFCMEQIIQQKYLLLDVFQGNIFWKLCFPLISC